MDLLKSKDASEQLKAAMDVARAAFKVLDKRGRRMLYRKLDQDFRPAKSVTRYKYYYLYWENAVMNLPDYSRSLTISILLKNIHEIYLQLSAEVESELSKLSKVSPTLKNRLDQMKCFNNINK